MKTLRLLAVACVFASAAFAQDLAWAELARRPELWPAQRSAKALTKFDGGVTVQAGQKLKVLQVTANEAQVAKLDALLKTPVRQP